MHQNSAEKLAVPSFSYRILDTLNASVLCLDASYQVQYVNSTAESLFESSASRLIGRPFSSLFSRFEPPSILEKLNLDAVALTEHEATITLSNGRSFIADYSLYPFHDPAELCEILIEIRPLERHAQFIREDQNQVQQLASQQLARGLAHEINNPLGGIRGAAQLLQREFDNPEWNEYTEVIISEVDR
ncbi:MAG: histidine kinase dimerization/phospho-acceptor domain-containing protein, partial [Pseudomonadota bacterium]